MENFKVDAQNMLDKNNARIAEMKEAIAIQVLSDASYIITIDGMAIDPEIKDHRTTGKAVLGYPHLVHRFSKENAERLAKTVRNGAEMVGQAVFWKDAAQRMIASLESTNEYLIKYINEH